MTREIKIQSAENKIEEHKIKLDKPFVETETDSTYATKRTLKPTESLQKMGRRWSRNRLDCVYQEM
jgi:hypothetical protein